MIVDDEPKSDTPEKVWAAYLAECERQKHKITPVTYEEHQLRMGMLEQYKQARERHKGRF